MLERGSGRCTRPFVNSSSFSPSTPPILLRVEKIKLLVIEELRRFLLPGLLRVEIRGFEEVEEEREVAEVEQAKEAEKRLPGMGLDCLLSIMPYYTIDVKSAPSGTSHKSLVGWELEAFDGYGEDAILGGGGQGLRKPFSARSPYRASPSHEGRGGTSDFPISIFESTPPAAASNRKPTCAPKRIHREGGACLAGADLSRWPASCLCCRPRERHLCIITRVERDESPDWCRPSYHRPTPT